MSPNEHPSRPLKKARTPSTSLRLGLLMRKRRRELELSLEDIERVTYIRRKYLRLIEAGDYVSLPDDVYSRGYVKNYADQLGFDSKKILKIYTDERHNDSLHTTKPITSRASAGLMPIGSPTYTITPRKIFVLLTSLFVFIMVGYIGWQFSQLSVPPVINLVNQPQSIVNSSFVIVSGEVDSGSDVFINNSPILTSTDGSFSDRVMLVDGSNQIIITARNKFGKESSKTIVVETKLDTPRSALPTNVAPASFDGVEVQVSIGPQATYLVVKADGKEVFKGTMLPGSKQLFSAKESIKLTTGNAGSTAVVITNAVLANKDIGSLGSEGEPKQDIIFNKDTNIK